MPSSLRAQLALVGILAVLLIPIGTSSLRGLTHVLTCEEDAQTPFSVELTEGDSAVITSSQVVTRELPDEEAEGDAPDGSGDAPEDAVAPAGSLCGGLSLEMLVASRDEDSADITLNITNGTAYGWRGSVRLQLDGASIPIEIGEVAPGETASDTVELVLDGDRRYELEGSLLIGP